jgi:hypothetical protein
VTKGQAEKGSIARAQQSDSDENSSNARKSYYVAGKALGVTASERAAIGQAIEAEIAKKERRGNPQLAANASNSERGKTADIAAKRAGFTSAETFERAKTVVEKGSAELRRAMDEKKVSISAAASSRIGQDGGTRTA